MSTSTALSTQLAEREQWVLRREKVPYQNNGTKAKPTEPDHWMSLPEAKQALAEGSFSGVGFVFTGDDPFVGIDLDHCVEDGKLEPWARELVDRMGSYAEWSPSGEGVHILVKGSLPEGRRRHDQVEMYDDERYFTVTGNHVEETPKEIKERGDTLTQVHQEYFGEGTTESSDSRPSDSEEKPLTEADKNLLNEISASDQSEKFRRLFKGDETLWSGENNTYDSRSEADFALLGILKFWTGGDREQMDRIFRHSSLYRQKWERKSYRERTMENLFKGDVENPWEPVRFLYDSDQGDEARLDAARRARDELRLATDRDSERIFAYDEEKKILRPDGEQKIDELLVRKLGKHHSTYQAREVKAKVRALTFQDKFGGNFIPVANGDLFLNPLELKDCAPDRAPLSRSQGKWDPDAICPRFRNHLRDVVPDDHERQTLQEYAGYCLYHWDIPFHKALFAVGPTASGKSTTLSVLRKILGNVSSLSPQQMVNGRFGAAELEGSWANVRSDLSSGLVKNVGLFKEIVGGDEIYIERKHEQGYTIRPTAKHLYAANQLPEASIDDDAFYRRILLISFPETIPEEDRKNRSVLDRKLEDELDGILRWAVEGLLRVLDNDGFTHDLSPKQTRRRWEEYVSSVGRFKASSMEVTGDTEDVISKEDAHTAYSNFCNQQGLSTKKKGELTRILKRDPQIEDAIRTPPHSSKRSRCYVGVKLH